MGAEGRGASGRDGGPRPRAGSANWLPVALIAGIAITAGVWLRAGELTRKPWWADELATWVVLSGCTSEDLAATWNGRARTAADLLGCQNVRAEGSTGAVLRALLDDGPQNLPLFYLMSRAAVLGLDWEWAPRLVSAIASILALLCGAALARELFGTWRAGAIAAALAAVSPLHLRFGLDARAYALWSLFTVASSWLLLRAYRRGRAADWVLFAVAQTLLLQTHLLALPASASLLVWGLVRQGGASVDARRRWRLHALALALAVVFILPWLLAGALRSETVRETLDWATRRMPVTELVRRWFGIATTIFLRTGADGGLLGPGEEPWRAAIRAAIGLAITAAIIVSLERAWRDHREALRFLFFLCVPLFVALALADLVGGGRRSMMARYSVPAWWAAQLVIAAALARGLGARGRARVAATIGFASLIGCGLWSCLRITPLPVWWDTDPPTLRALVTEAERAKTHPAHYWIERAPRYQVLGFARLLPPDTRITLGGAPPESEREACTFISPFGGDPGTPPSRVFRCDQAS